MSHRLQCDLDSVPRISTLQTVGCSVKQHRYVYTAYHWWCCVEYVQQSRLHPHRGVQLHCCQSLSLLLTFFITAGKVSSRSLLEEPFPTAKVFHYSKVSSSSLVQQPFLATRSCWSLSPLSCLCRGISPCQGKVPVARRQWDSTLLQIAM